LIDQQLLVVGRGGFSGFVGIGRPEPRVSEGSAMLKLHGTFSHLVLYDFGDAEIRGHFTIEIRGHFTIEK
jgi:hypothetical protein